MHQTRVAPYDLHSQLANTTVCVIPTVSVVKGRQSPRFRTLCLPSASLQAAHTHCMFPHALFYPFPFLQSTKVICAFLKYISRPIADSHLRVHLSGPSQVPFTVLFHYCSRKRHTQSRWFENAICKAVDKA